MNSLYVAADPLEAEIVKQYLASHGIEVRILGGALWGGRGDLALDVYPRLVLDNERDAGQARELLAVYERRRHAHALWNCACGEASPVTFETCWSCGVERPA